MIESSTIGPWIRRFLQQHLVDARNLSPNTQASYRDTLVQLLPFVSEKSRTKIDKLCITQISAEMVRLFLLHVEEKRKCSIATRNQRLAGIHAMARFIAHYSPEHIAWCQEICSVPFKKTVQATTRYLEKNELDALLSSPDRNSAQGARDFALLLFLYNTGARASEASNVTIGDLDLGPNKSVRILGKGKKIRNCPLWTLTCQTIIPHITGRQHNEKVFLNCRSQPITRFGIHQLVKRYASKLAETTPSLRNKSISAHSIRHTTAVHLLRAGVDINTIRAWLGHVSLTTTNIYAEVDLEMKTRALTHCEILAPRGSKKRWKEKPDLMEFLKAL
jgi:site-specific recombinase XerD